MTKNCSDICIPLDLHQNIRLIDLNFTENEKLYRRFDVPLPKDIWLDDKQKSARVFKFEDDSYNREKYSKASSDVLLNINANDCSQHFYKWGILSIKISDINGISFNVESNGKKCQITFEPIHDPKPCMYPHTELHSLKDGIRITPLSPKSAKAIARDIFIEKCEILKEPKL